MSVETYQVLIGAHGWLHQSWENNFYPEDLPADWMLGFYSNEFPVVYVPSTSWCGDEIENEPEQWCEDIAETFSFLFEVESSILKTESAFDACLAKLDNLGSHCLGLVLNIDDELVSQEESVTNLIDKAKQVTRVCVRFFVDDIPHSFLKMLENKRVSITWQEEKPFDEQSFTQGNLSLSIARGESLDSVALRHLVENGLKASTEDRVSVLIIDGQPPSLEVMRNADVILGLL